MDISGVAISGPQLAQPKIADVTHLPPPKMRIDAPAHGVMHLLQSASLELKSNPPHLGKNIDTFA